MIVEHTAILKRRAQNVGKRSVRSDTLAVVILVVLCLSLSLQCHIMAEDDGLYVLPGSDIRYLTEADLLGVPDQIMRYGRNEIFARHGRMFKSEELNGWFQAQNWYQGSIPGDQFDDSVLNKYERFNVQLLLEKEADAYKMDQPGYSYDAVYEWIAETYGTAGPISVDEGQENGGPEDESICADYNEYLSQKHHEDSGFVFDIERFSVYDVDGDGTDELLTYGGGQIDYTKLFAISDGIVQNKGATTSYTFYDNGIVRSFFGGGMGYDLYTFYRIEDGCELSRLFSYAEWFSLGEGIYKIGDQATDSTGDTCSWEEIQTQIDELTGNAAEIPLTVWDNTEENRALVFGQSADNEQTVWQNGKQVFSGVVWVTTWEESLKYLLTTRGIYTVEGNGWDYLLTQDRAVILKLDPGTEVTAHRIGEKEGQKETHTAILIQLPEEFAEYNGKHIMVKSEYAEWPSQQGFVDLCTGNSELVTVLDQ